MNKILLLVSKWILVWKLAKVCDNLLHIESVQIEAAEMNYLAPPPVYNEHELRGAESRTDDNMI